MAGRFDSNVDVPEKAAVGDEYSPLMKQMLRWISKNNISSPNSGYNSIEDVDRDLTLWLEKGYALKNTHFFGENPEAYGMFYVLVKSK